MNLVRYTDVEEFAEVTAPFLAGKEEEFNLFLAVLESIRAGEQTHPPFLAIVQDDTGAVDTIAMRTPPWNLLLGPSSREGLMTVARTLRDERDINVPGVHARMNEAAWFAEIWSDLTGCSAVLDKELRAYSLAALTMPYQVSGTMRTAVSADRDLVAEWSDRFAEDSGMNDSAEARRARTQFMLDGGRFVLWEDEGKAVSMAGWHPSPPRGARIGYVYTPPELRGRGYATGITAGLSRQLLNSGCTQCFLFTDLTNPTSNSIYQKIGYEPVADFHEYLFGKAAENGNA